MTDTHTEGPKPNFEPPTHVSPAALAAQRPQRSRNHIGMITTAVDGFRSLELDLFVPDSPTGPVPCVVWIHGGAWLFGSRALLPDYWPAGSLFQQLIDAGLAVATIDYRHSREAPFPAQLHDGVAALRWLAQYGPELGIDPDRLGIWGESAGAHLASLLALVTDPQLQGTEGAPVATPRIRAAVSFYGIADVDRMPSMFATMPPEWVEELTRAAGGKPAEPLDVFLNDSPWPRAQANRLASPIHHVHPDAPPFLLIHGEADGLVPFEQSVMLEGALRQAGVSVELIAVPGADHVFLGADPLVPIAKAVAFLGSHL
ncbi:MAG: alpha/beta hydrolase [Actinobacteria bacterium]|nr:alpha/beta hydrolase [Actinomycetota bacterium]